MPHRRQPPVDCTDESLLERFRSGEEGVVAELFERYRWFVRSRARGYFLVGAEYDDLEQEGLIGLFKAVRDYEPARQVSFRCFAELCVTRQIVTAIRAATRAKHQPLNRYVSLSVPGLAPDGSAALEALLDDHRLPDPAEELASAEERRQVRACMDRVLSELEVDVLRLYLDGFTYQEIGARLGRPVKAVDNALQRIKRKLEAHLQAPGAVARLAVMA